MTHWESESAFDGWVGSEEYREGHKRVGDFKGADGRVELTSRWRSMKSSRMNRRRRRK